MDHVFPCTLLGGKYPSYTLADAVYLGGICIGYIMR